MSQAIDLAQLLEEVRHLTKSTKPALVAIDGMSGAGKSTLARLLHDQFGGQVLHMDDFFLQPHQRTPERLAETGGNVDYERFVQEVLKPLKGREEMSYRAFDCKTLSFKGPVVLEPAPLWIVEGCYCLHPKIDLPYDLSLFLEIAPLLQLQTIEKRNGPEMAKRFKETWIPMENLYFETFAIRDKCHWIMKRA